MRHHDVSFTVALTCISRVLILRDRIFGWVGPGSRDTPGLSATPLKISSGRNLLDAVFVQPTANPARAAMLLCHGIGETVQHWFPVQQLLAANGVSSLLFDYSGYGRSTGHPSGAQFDLDALSAFQTLQRLTHPLPTAILGFSLGSGPAAAIVNTAAPDHLFLCAAFTSFRDAVCAIGLPARFSPARSALMAGARVPPRLPCLCTGRPLRQRSPLSRPNGARLASCCPVPAEVVIVHGCQPQSALPQTRSFFLGPHHCADPELRGS